VALACLHRHLALCALAVESSHAYFKPPESVLCLLWCIMNLSLVMTTKHSHVASLPQLQPKWQNPPAGRASAPAIDPTCVI
jgi:hypothetical protein